MGLGTCVCDCRRRKGNIERREFELAIGDFCGFSAGNASVFLRLVFVGARGQGATVAVAATGTGEGQEVTTLMACPIGETRELSFEGRLIDTECCWIAVKVRTELVAGSRAHSAGYVSRTEGVFIEAVICRVARTADERRSIGACIRIAIAVTDGTTISVVRLTAVRTDSSVIDRQIAAAASVNNGPTVFCPAKNQGTSEQRAPLKEKHGEHR